MVLSLKICLRFSICDQDLEWLSIDITDGLDPEK